MPTWVTTSVVEYVLVKKIMSPGRIALGGMGVVWLKIPCAVVRGRLKIPEWV
jgi:hypothetical protein